MQRIKRAIIQITKSLCNSWIIKSFLLAQSKETSSSFLLTIFRIWGDLCLNLCLYCDNRPRSIYQYSNMAPRLSGQNSIFGVVFFVSKSPLGIERQKKLEKFAILTRKPRSHVRILIYRTWPIAS